MISVAKDIIKDAPRFFAEKFVDAGNGYEALQMPDGRYVTCVGPDDFHYDATSIGPWQKCKRSGQIVIWHDPVRTVMTWAAE